VSGVSVTGFTKPKVVHEFFIQFTTYMPAGDKLLNPIGGNGEYPGRFRFISGVRNKSRYYYPPHAPGESPIFKRRRVDVTGDTTPRRTAASVAASATAVETARRAGHSKAAERRLAQKDGFKGYSLFFAHSPADKARYPGLKYLWHLVSYDTMHYFLSSVVARLWELFADENEKLGDDQPLVTSKASREAIGREIKAGRATIPLNKARALRDTSNHSSSYKAVDWMFFLLSAGEVVLADPVNDGGYSNGRRHGCRFQCIQWVEAAGVYG